MPQKLLNQMRCPNCGKRAFDISSLPTEDTTIEIKCPQCTKFVSISLTKEYLLTSMAPKPLKMKHYRPKSTT